MNKIGFAQVSEISINECFRPQQGLTIMNYKVLKQAEGRIDRLKFPSPTGVNYYELYGRKNSTRWLKRPFPSPTGVNYYEYGS